MINTQVKKNKHMFNTKTYYIGEKRQDKRGKTTIVQSWREYFIIKEKLEDVNDFLPYPFLGVKTLNAFNNFIYDR